MSLGPEFDTLEREFRALERTVLLRRPATMNPERRDRILAMVRGGMLTLDGLARAVEPETEV